MSRAFEVLDVRPTPMGELLLRRRLEPTLQVDIWEVKLGEEFLMSSLFTAGERAVAALGLGAVPDDHGDRLDVLVGGLGLGYTAREALADDRVAAVTVVDALPEVIEWHRDGLVPLGAELTGDARCRIVHGDFFALAGAGFATAGLSERFDAILVDIDHTPRFWLAPEHAGFYSAAGFGRVIDQLHPGGVFSLWSDDMTPDDDFVALLAGSFADARAEVVSFPNHYTGAESTSTIYLASAPRATMGA